jgi:biopolymer transport protein ExbD
MKLKGAKAVHYDSGPNMTPLVDVVMVILIFLMLAGSFVARITGMFATNDSDKLAEELTTKFKNFLAAGNNRDTLEVVIHPAKNVRYEYLVQVYQAALQAQFPKVAFATSS